jgi:hypothetical protein
MNRIRIFGIDVVPAVLITVFVQPSVLIEAEKFAFLRKIIPNDGCGFGVRNDAEMMLFVAVAAKADARIDDLSENRHCWKAFSFLLCLKGLLLRFLWLTFDLLRQRPNLVSTPPEIGHPPSRPTEPSLKLITLWDLMAQRDRDPRVLVREFDERLPLASDRSRYVAQCHTASSRILLKFVQLLSDMLDESAIEFAVRQSGQGAVMEGVFYRAVPNGKRPGAQRM